MAGQKNGQEQDIKSVTERFAVRSWLDLQAKWTRTHFRLQNLIRHITHWK